jgi:hypothetical protein
MLSFANYSFYYSTSAAANSLKLDSVAIEVFWYNGFFFTVDPSEVKQPLLGVQ